MDPFLVRDEAQNLSAASSYKKMHVLQMHIIIIPHIVKLAEQLWLVDLL